MTATAAEPSDAELLGAHVAGDPTAFNELMSRHADRLWTLSIRLVRHPDDAADALQNAMLSAFRRADGFRGEAAVSTWLHRIVVNACLDLLRHRKTHPAVPLPEAPDGIALADPTGDPADAVIAAAVHDEVAVALARIGADQRAAIVLVDLMGYPVEQAAAMLGCAPGTIKSRCARGRAKLAPLLRHLVSEVN